MSKLLKKIFSLNKNYIEHLIAENSYKRKAFFLYKLGLYRTILTNPEYKNTYPYIISLYACGYNEQAETILNKYKESSEFYNNRLGLAIGLLPFEPKIAYSLLKLDKVDSLLEASILASISNFDELSKLLFSLESGKFRRCPELYLINNFVNSEPYFQLENINKYLDCFDLDRIDLVNVMDNPSVTNIRVKKGHIRALSKFNESSPLISIVVTTYNSADYIISTLNSLVCQTYPNKEIIVVDDNSLDETSILIQKMILDYPYIKLIQLKRNVGTYLAKTIGTCLSKGEFVTNHDSDDWAHPRKIELQILPLLKDSKMVVSFSKWIRLKSDGTFYSRSVTPLTRLNPSSALFRKKEVMEQTGLWDLVRTGADSEFNARLKLVFKNRYITINKPLTIGAHRENSLMTSKETGYSSSGKSLTRLLYWESWNNWHIRSIKNKKALKLHYTQDRIFWAPASIRVNYEDIVDYFELYKIPLF